MAEVMREMSTDTKQRLSLDLPEYGEPFKKEVEDSQTKIPFGLNRYVYLCFMILLLLFWGPLVLSWGELQSMLEKDGVYLWLCDGSDSNHELEDGSCKYQQVVLGQIGIYGATMYCLGALLGGFIVDHFGPKVCCICGGICNILGYLMLSIGSKKVPTFFPFGIFLGFSVELVFLGTVSSPNLFPNRKQLVLSLLAMARSASMLLCIAMNHLRSDSYSARRIGYTFLGIGAIFFVLVVLLVPSKPFTFSEKQRPESVRPSESVTAAAADLEKTPRTDNLSLKQDSNKNIPESQPAKTEGKSGNYRLWIRTLADPFYFLWLLCDSLLLVRCNFHIVSLSSQHPRVVSTFGILAGVGFVLCPFTGWCVDLVGAIPVIFVLNLFGTVGFVSLICGDSMGAQVLGVICISVVLSYSGTQNFALMTEFYSQDLVGKLTGLVTFMGGLLTLTNTPVWNWAKLNDTWKSANAIYLGYSAFCMAVISLLWWGPAWLFKNLVSPDGKSALRPYKKKE